MTDFDPEALRAFIARHDTKLIAELDREAVRAFMVGHGIKLAAFARHAGIPYQTMRYMMALGRVPSDHTIARLIDAMQRTPPESPLKHSAIVREFWGSETSEAIGRRCGVSGAYIRALANRMGLPSASRAAE